ncbi:MAG: sensor histidine kinase, partial [Ramlibacter sp.]
ELRTPLAALKLQVQSLERCDSRADGEQARKLAISRLSAGIERATRLVEQLLVLARQEANEAPRQPVELADLARRAVADLIGVAQNRQIDLGLQRADEGEVRGQPEALMILLRNLVDNAIKYTPAGGTVDVSVVAEQGAAGKHLSVTIEDSGPGIPPEERERVFDRFYRVPGSDAAGSGLGLAIIKAIAERHGATLALGESKRLGGLEAVVRFPA